MLKFVAALVTSVMCSGAAAAADLYVPPAPSTSAAPADPWDGPYIGASLGYAWATQTSAAHAPLDFSGLLVGGDLGYLFRLSDSFVVGVEGNIDWSGLSGTGVTHVFTVNPDGSIRAKVGIDAGNFLPYIEGGFALANADSVPVGGGTSLDRTYVGWTAGAGVEYLIADHVSSNLDLRYDNYGSQDFGGGSVAVTDTQLRIGLNYHF